MKGTFISPLSTRKGRCSQSLCNKAHMAFESILFAHTPWPSPAIHYAKSTRIVEKFRKAEHPYCTIHSPRYSSINHYPAQRTADVLSRVKYSLFSNVAIDDEVDHHHTPSLKVGHPHENPPRHCQTCTCSNDGEDKLLETSQCYIDDTMVKANNRYHRRGILPDQSSVCHLPEPLIAPNTPLPPPLPKPEYSFKGRILPPNLLAFDSPEGKSRFLHSLQTNNAEAYFPLSQQFLNQMDPAYCGVSTLLLVLNALSIDPNVRWRGGWRWYGDESMLLERCCLEEERVRREGITLEQYCGLARCQGVELVMKRPGGKEGQNVVTEAGGDIDQFRQDIINAVNFPPQTDRGLSKQAVVESSNGGYFIVASFARSSLQQTGDGHFSPIAAYHPPTDSCLVLDVARFKYAPYWVDLKELYDAMIPADKLTDKSRGWVLMFPPANAKIKVRQRGTNEQVLVKEELEGKRPAVCVPLSGTGECICPVEKIKIEFCSVASNESAESSE
jgi:glutathione gamma-glutamylcysteinyltransferase